MQRFSVSSLLLPPAPSPQITTQLYVWSKTYFVLELRYLQNYLKLDSVPTLRLSREDHTVLAVQLYTTNRLSKQILEESEIYWNFINKYRSSNPEVGLRLFYKVSRLKWFRNPRSFLSVSHQQTAANRQCLPLADTPRYPSLIQICIRRTSRNENSWKPVLMWHIMSKYTISLLPNTAALDRSCVNS
jgi:hypothetical protein